MVSNVVAQDGDPYVKLDGEICFQIANSHTMPPFFMSLVGASDHWMFVASNGALTAGRQDPDNALFPYYSSDKLLDFSESAGPKTIIRSDGQIWEPFSAHLNSRVRNLYKNVSGSKLHFEELNLEMELAFRYSWEFSSRFGFVRTCHVTNIGSHSQSIEVLDGMRNLMPYGINEFFQLRYSNLGNAYKKSELLEDCGLGLFYLSSIPSDRAEPSEGLRATVVWQTGLEDPTILLCEDQLETWKQGQPLEQETEIRGQRGAFFAGSKIELAAGETKTWTIVADLKHDQTDVANLASQLGSGDMLQAVNDDLQTGQNRLLEIVSASDGIQVGNHRRRTQRHRANVMFNLMRGGTPFSGYEVCTRDFAEHVQARNQAVFIGHQELLETFSGSTVSFDELSNQISGTNDPDLIRIASEYLPLTFGRRHGDPSRPWNTFSIDLKNDDGSDRLDYQGNWRDIFQNWEGLGLSYPLFFNGMVLRFLNASTADGYNPYRLSKKGFDWERPDPEDPWANIGYWGDHQIIYLAKLMEWSRNCLPDQFQKLMSMESAVYADLPYRIRDYESILQDPNNTIDYDLDVEQQIESRVAEIGFDGQLLTNQSSEIHRVSVIEKLILTALVKMSNFVPEGGIWLNTQRPEWNDANNALVGNGASVVTVCYLHRYFLLLKQSIAVMQASGSKSCLISEEVFDFLEAVRQILVANKSLLSAAIPDQQRKEFVDQMQKAGESYRSNLYQKKLSGNRVEVELDRLSECASTCNEFLVHAIRANQRPDKLFHTYNLLSFDDQGLEVEHLQEMLEGQVAVLSSKLLSGQEAIEVLNALRESEMYRSDIDTYLLYPDRDLPRFMEKNLLDENAIANSKVLTALVKAGNQSIIRRDANGKLHFNGDFRNSEELAVGLEKLAATLPEYASLVDQEKGSLVELFETIFDHRRFTGRSGTFFGYEGLGCVYWHMVSKLDLAVIENFEWAAEVAEPAEVLQQLKAHYRSIRNGLGVEGSPQQYGAFPTDPYSHTPSHAGAQQPGMTGQVKEDILSRLSETGVRIRNGVVSFDTSLIERSEFLDSASAMKFVNLEGDLVELDVESGCYGFTLCQIPVVFRLLESEDASERLMIFQAGQSEPESRAGNSLTADESRSMFMRDNTIEKIEFSFFVADH